MDRIKLKDIVEFATLAIDGKKRKADKYQAQYCFGMIRMADEFLDLSENEFTELNNIVRSRMNEFYAK